MSSGLENKGDMVYVGRKPWHDMGNPVKSIDELPPCLAFEIAMRDMFYGDMQGKARESRFKSIIRTDTGDELGVASAIYKPHQNQELWDSLRSFCEAGNMTMETAGTLKGGKYVWLLAKIEKEFGLARNPSDRQELYALLATAHDLSMKSVVKPTTTRVVCWNTLSLALGDTAKDYGQSHRSNFDVSGAKDFVATAILGFEQYQAQVETLAACNVNPALTTAFAMELVNEDAFKKCPLINATKEFDQLARAQFSRLLADSDRAANAFLEYAGRTENRPLKQLSADISTEQNGIAGQTAWGMFNGVTRYIDHNHGRTPDNRLSNAWFGPGDVLKRRGLELASEYTEALS